jgi:ankyrin repeat protein
MSSTRPEWYQLRNALEQGDPSAAAALLEQDPALIDERNGLGETVLHFLAVENNLPPVEWLHSQGADLNVTNKFGTPLLFEVARPGYEELLLWLIKHGADPKMKNADGETIEEYLAYIKEPGMIAFIKAHVAS